MGKGESNSAGRSKQPRSSSPEKRYDALNESSKAWDSRIKGSIELARKASRKSAV
jgi:hypothetical protein